MSKHWSGFVRTNEATEETLFYVLIESESDPASDPVIWWMNGGPGASSLAGMFLENGPLLFNDAGNLVRNPLTWAQHANILYVEFGPGIGWSSCMNSTGTSHCQQSDPGCNPCYASDSSTAEGNLMVAKAIFSGESPLFPARPAQPP